MKTGILSLILAMHQRDESLGFRFVKWILGGAKGKSLAHLFFGPAFFVKNKKVVLSRLNLFVLEKNKKDFKQTAPSLMQKGDNLSYFE